MKYIEGTPQEIREFNSQKSQPEISVSDRLLAGNSPSDTFSTKNEIEDFIKGVLRSYYNSTGNEEDMLSRLDELFLLWSKLNKINFVETVKYFGLDYRDFSNHYHHKLKIQIEKLKQENKSSVPQNLVQNPICKCGHIKFEHQERGKDVRCMYSNGRGCNCKEFTSQDKEVQKSA